MMVGFSKKDINTQPGLGEQLERARTERELSLQQAARQCSISVRYLKALESGDYNKLPGEVYARNFLKTYATFLGLNTEKLLAQYTSARAVYRSTTKEGSEKMHAPVAKVQRKHMLSMPQLIRGALVLSLAFVVVGYLGVKVKGIVEAPELIIESPSIDMVTSDTSIAVTGMAELGTNVTINGQQVIADESGKFEETVDLQNGVNTIEVRAKKKRSKETVITRQIVVVQDQDNS